MRILDLTFTHLGHPLHRGRMTNVESHKGATLASRLTIRSWLSQRRERRGFANNPVSRLFDVIAGSHFPAFGPSDIPLRRLHQQGKYRGLHSATADARLRWHHDNYRIAHDTSNHRSSAVDASIACTWGWLASWLSASPPPGNAGAHTRRHHGSCACARCPCRGNGAPVN